MFGRKKDVAKISGRTPVFHVRYIGCTETWQATGRGCSYAPVQRLWDNSAAERNMRKVAVHINSAGLSLRHLSDKPATSTTPHQQQEQQQGQGRLDFDIGDISFCNVDRAVNERIFSWIYRNDRLKRLDCHAVLCSSAQKAHTMAIVLSRAFQIAYKDWRTHHRDHDSAVARSSTSTTSTPSPSSSRSEITVSNTAVASQPTSSETSTVTSSPDKKEEGTSSSTLAQSSPSLHCHSAPFGNDVAMTSSDSENATSSGSVKQSTASSQFVSSSIWDPEMEGLVGSVDCLQADLDLEEEGSY